MIVAVTTIRDGRWLRDYWWRGILLRVLVRMCLPWGQLQQLGDVPLEEKGVDDSVPRVYKPKELGHGRAPVRGRDLLVASTPTTISGNG